MLAYLLERFRPLAGTAIRALKRRVARWTKPAASTSQVLGTVADLVRSRSELVAENALLRQQLIALARAVKRPRLARSDRPLLVLLASRVRAWQQALLIVQPETLLRWHREGFRLFWRWRSAPRRRPVLAPWSVQMRQPSSGPASRRRLGRQPAAQRQPMFAQILHRVHDLVDAAVRALRRRPGKALRSAVTSPVVVGAATDLVGDEAGAGGRWARPTDPLAGHVDHAKRAGSPRTGRLRAGR